MTARRFKGPVNHPEVEIQLWWRNCASPRQTQSRENFMKQSRNSRVRRVWWSKAPRFLLSLFPALPPMVSSPKAALPSRRVPFPMSRSISHRWRAAWNIIYFRLPRLLQPGACWRTAPAVPARAYTNCASMHCIHAFKGRPPLWTRTHDEQEAAWTAACRLTGSRRLLLDQSQHICG